MWKRNSPADEVLGDLRQIVELAPATQQEHPAHGDPCKQGGEPGEVPGDPFRPANEPICQHPHVPLLLSARRAITRTGIIDREALRVIACNEACNSPVYYQVSLDSAAKSAAVAGFRRSQPIPFRPRSTVPLQCGAEGARFDRAHPGPLMIESGRGEATEEQLARLL